MTRRDIAKKVTAEAVDFGNGAVVVLKAIGGGYACIRFHSDNLNGLKHLDPFVALDEFNVSPPSGFPDHPHRGFEAVTLMLQGAFSYEDFYRNKGTLHAGDVQWMRVGKGIMHSEKPAEDNSHGLQIWINLPTIAKSYDPSYQNIRATEIPQAEKNGVRVRVIAGEALGVEAPCHSVTPTMILDFTLRPNAELHQSIPTPWNALAYVIQGEGTFGKPDSSPVYAHEAVVLSAGDGVRVWNNSSTDLLRFLLLAGQPLNEPVVQYGPFVMNTQAEIDQTIQDYRSREHVFGRGKTWTSSN